MSHFQHTEISKCYLGSSSGPIVLLLLDSKYCILRLCFCFFPSSASSRDSGGPRKQHKAEPDVSNLKTMPKGLSASLPDLESESWIEVKKRPRPSPARPKVSEPHASAETIQTIHPVKLNGSCDFTRLLKDEGDISRMTKHLPI